MAGEENGAANYDPIVICPSETFPNILVSLSFWTQPKRSSKFLFLIQIFSALFMTVNKF
jgi:hypothetical protein